MSREYDIIIVGGGLVGASLGFCLSASHYRVALVEAHAINPPQPSNHERTLALTQGSRNILASMDVWDELHAEATPIKHIHVSHRGHFGSCRIHHHEHGVEALGYIVPFRCLGKTLYDRLTSQSKVQVFCPAQFKDLKQNGEHVQLSVQCDDGIQELRCRLLVAADGAESPVREGLGIAVTRQDYQQTAVLSTVNAERAHQHTAYERFTDNGPLALLPLGADRCSLIWTHRPEQVENTLQLDDKSFTRALQEQFGYRLGRFVKVGPRKAFPLSLVSAQRLAEGRVLLLGNAAHTLHPVAGQGFNLALRDVAVLTELLLENTKEDPANVQILMEYEDWRNQDFKNVLRFTDVLARLFANDWPPIVCARTLSLLTIDLITPVREVLAKQSMGMSGRQPRLACGFSLHDL